MKLLIKQMIPTFPKSIVHVIIMLLLSMILGLQGCNDRQVKEAIIVNTNEWKHNIKAPYPIEITDGDGSVFFQDRWWTFGGWSHELGAVNDVYAYDFNSDSWEKMPSPPYGSWTHQGASVIEVDGEERIYMMGGYIDRQLTDAVYYFDGDKWQVAETRMPVALWNFICVTKNLNISNLVPFGE